LDPWANCDEVLHEYGLVSVKELDSDKKFDGAILAVSHSEFLELDLTAILKPNSVVFDVKGILPNDKVDGRL
jgi:UDP-N-acetyl-D-galactosamine dehydrogenase